MNSIPRPMNFCIEKAKVKVVYSIYPQQRKIKCQPSFNPGLTVCSTDTRIKPGNLIWNKRSKHVRYIRMVAPSFSQHCCLKKRKRDKREIYDGDTREETT